jgi:uncharacterized protein YjdB
LANITKLTNDQISDLDKMCSGSKNAKLGLIINSIIDAVNLKHEYSGIEFTIESKNILNKLCPAVSSIKLGDLIEQLIIATGGSDSVNTISSAQINVLNNKTCFTLKEIALGTKLSQIITKINAEDPIRVVGLSIDETKEVIVGSPEIITITWNPVNATNKDYTVVSSDETKATVAKNEDGTFTITGLVEGTSTITITPTDGGVDLAEICLVTVTAE